MLNPGAHLLDLLDRREPAIWVCVARSSGSVPREAGTTMIVTASRTLGTIGGGHLELRSIEVARELLTLGTTAATRRHFPLGPALGQCCGGSVDVAFLPITEADRDQLSQLRQIEARGGAYVVNRRLDTGDELTLPLRFDPWSIWVFGAGHVGIALVTVLSTMPCNVTWVDSRETPFPTAIPGNARVIESDAPESEVRHIPAGASVLVLTHSHALDLEICLELLKRDDLAYCGLIGSATKAAIFNKRFAARGFTGTEIARITCPIGLPTLRSKHPGVIAAGVAADLAERREKIEWRIMPGPVAHNNVT
jgi:xanthine dehydrogenase accessory factor